MVGMGSVAKQGNLEISLQFWSLITLMLNYASLTRTLMMLLQQGKPSSYANLTIC